eukprot:1160827-Pelagomonas_calceolata.AAC.6
MENRGSSSKLDWSGEWTLKSPDRSPPGPRPSEGAHTHKHDDHFCVNWGCSKGPARRGRSACSQLLSSLCAIKLWPLYWDRCAGWAWATGCELDQKETNLEAHPLAIREDSDVTDAQSADVLPGPQHCQITPNLVGIALHKGEEHTSGLRKLLMHPQDLKLETNGFLLRTTTEIFVHQLPKCT